MSDINFVTVDAEQITSELINDFESYTGETLHPGDARRLFLQGFAYVLVNLINNINTTGRSNLLRYAYGSTLDALGELYGVVRLAAQSAKTTVRFTLSEAQPGAITIPAGTRVTPDGKLFYSTDSVLTIAAGSTTGDVSATALEAGTSGNGYTAGQVNKLVDGNAYVASIANTTTTSGGADAESDDDYRERLRKAPYSYSTAGPIQAYEYWAKNANSDVGDVYINSSSAGNITIYVLKSGGVIPASDDAVIATVLAACSDSSRRPLTDNVSVVPATASNTTIDMEYYISPDNSANSAAIQSAVAAAVDAYKAWQTAVIGRTINPDELRKLVLNAGASRVDITAPARATLTTGQVAQFTATSVLYEGLGE